MILKKEIGNMIEITKQNHLFSAVFGIQQIKNEKYRKASFVIEIEVEEGNLLYNTLSKQILLLSTEEKKILMGLTAEKVPLKLIENYFYVPIDNDDFSMVSKFISIYKQLYRPKKNYISYTIMTTMECNARCFYCFERDGRTVDSMSIKTSDDVAEFICKNSVTGETIELVWFGGEPLLNTEVINNICEKLKNNNILFKSKIVTNGYLFGKKMINEAKNKWNLNIVQVTLDGTETTYNRVKNYIYDNDASPFLLVIDNIKNLIQSGIFVQIRLNMDLYNSSEMISLLSFIKKEFYSFEHKYCVSLHLINEKDNDAKLRHTQEERKTLLDSFRQVMDYIIVNKIPTGKRLTDYYRIVHCCADDDRAIVITPSGKFTKCQNYSDTEIIGDLYSKDLNKDIINSWKEVYNDIELCKDCPVLPDCTPIKKCPSEIRCDVFQREERIINLEIAILNAYNRYKRKKNENKK